jgi:hypothetical protein
MEVAAALPTSMQGIVSEALSTGSDERARALCTELRVAVQTHNEDYEQRKQHVALARKLLETLETSVPLGEDRLKQTLDLIIAGVRPFSDTVAQQVEAAIASSDETRHLEEAKMAGEIVERTLQDLGYAVAPIESTLFVRGGVTYFKKASWGQYCMRVAVRPREQKINFNAVRIEAHTNDQSSPDRFADLQIENDWCQELPKVMETLRARGLDTSLLRQVMAGSVPVPLVSSTEVQPSMVPEARGTGRVGTARPQVKPRNRAL